MLVTTHALRIDIVAYPLSSAVLLSDPNGSSTGVQVDCTALEAVAVAGNGR
jgi:hypothetical protein